MLTRPCVSETVERHANIHHYNGLTPGIVHGFLAKVSLKVTIKKLK